MGAVLAKVRDLPDRDRERLSYKLDSGEWNKLANELGNPEMLVLNRMQYDDLAIWRDDVSGV